MSPRDAVAQLQKQMETSIVGQRDLLRQMIVALLANGHLLLESLRSPWEGRKFRQCHVDRPARQCRPPIPATR